MPHAYPIVVVRTALKDAIAATETYHKAEEERFAAARRPAPGRRRRNVTRGLLSRHRRYEARIEVLEAALAAMRNAVHT